jgi:hypothetical protein
MRVVTSDNFAYRVQFVHSAHDPKHLVVGVPGGLRQLVDNLAASFRRRVTMCEIAFETVKDVADEFEGTYRARPEGVDPAQVRQFTPIAQGFAKCHRIDQFVKYIGRGRSLKRALRVSGLDAQTQQELAEACDFDLVTLKNLF